MKSQPHCLSKFNCYWVLRRSFGVVDAASVVSSFRDLLTVPNPFYFDVSGVRAQPGVRAFFSGGFRFTALSPPGFPIAPAEQAGSRINVKPVDRRNLAVSQSV